MLRIRPFTGENIILYTGFTGTEYKDEIETKL